MMATDLRRKPYDLIEFDEDENVICEIRKHSFGLFMVYATGILIVLAVLMSGASFSIWVENKLTGASNTVSESWLATMAGIIISIVIMVMTLIYGYIFKSNIVVLTNEKIAQIIYRSLFDRKVSQLNISDVQDVTVNQKGIFARVFNYGTIVIETAGEQQNYTFTFAPNPHEAAKQIIAAHEANVKRFGN